MMLVNNIQSID